jgi:predicted ATP-grasp superfamily ATP-dependent carboligase
MKAITQQPCVVLGLETQIGLAVVRELGRAGVPVIGIAHKPEAIGLRSRYLQRGIVVPQPRSAELLERLRSLGRELGPASLLAISEVNLSWLDQHRHELGDLRPALPAREQLQWVLDKSRTLAAAREVGIAVPESHEPGSLDEALALGERLHFPVVLKWADPNAVAPRLREHGLALLKTEFVLDASGWEAAARRYAAVGQWPIVQAYCPGVGLGQFFFMHQGQAVRRFQHLRVAEWPPEGGYSSVCDAVPLSRHAELQAASVRLLQRIGWEGVAMVEYRWDAATDQAVLMEINGRFWGSFPLAVHGGAGFALLAHAAALGLPLPTMAEPASALRCRMLSTELKRLVRILMQPGRIADPMFVRRPARELVRFVADFLRPRVRYFVWAVDDPAPWFRDLRNLLGGR